MQKVMKTFQNGEGYIKVKVIIARLDFVKKY